MGMFTVHSGLSLWAKGEDLIVFAWCIYIDYSFEQRMLVFVFCLFACFVVVVFFEAVYQRSWQL